MTAAEGGIVNIKVNWKDAAIGYAVIAGVAAVLLAIFWANPAGPDSTPQPIPYSAPPVPTLDPAHTWGGTLCRDGWVSHSIGRGTCSHHGGEA